MLGIKQSRDHVTNKSLYQLIGQVPLRERQLKLRGNYIHMLTYETTNRFVLIEHQVIFSTKKKYINQVSSHILLYFHCVFRRTVTLLDHTKVGQGRVECDMVKYGTVRFVYVGKFRHIELSISGSTVPSGA